MSEGIGDDETLGAAQPAQAVECRPERCRHPYAVDEAPVAVFESFLAHLKTAALADAPALGEADVNIEIVFAADVHAEHPGGRQPAQDAVVGDHQLRSGKPKLARVRHILVDPD